MKRLFGILFLVMLFFFACEKDDNVGNDDGNDKTIFLVFFSLTTDKDTVSSGETATITALATGYDLKYTWSATAGSILGSGKEVSYTACLCSLGGNIITCTVTDSNNDSDSKSVSIFVIN